MNSGAFRPPEPEGDAPFRSPEPVGGVPFRSPEPVVHTPARVAELVAGAAGAPLRLEFHENRTTLASARHDPRTGWRVRLHREFLRAPEPVFHHLGRFLRTRDPAGWNAVRDFAQAIAAARPAPAPDSPSTRPARARRILLRVRGRHADLAALLAEVNQGEFGGKHGQVRITWGRDAGARGARRRAIRFGSYDCELRLIRIHPSLDRPDLPEGFLRYLVFHELLHAEYPPRREGRRWVRHSRELQARERQYPRFAEMQRAMKQLLRETP